MEKHIKNRLAALGILILFVPIILSACQQAATTTPISTKANPEQVTPLQTTQTSSTNTPSLKGKKLAALLPGPISDGGWNKTAYESLIKLHDRFGLEINYRENVKVEEAAQLMREYAETGYDIIFSHGNEYTEATKQVSAEYPKVKFIQTSCPLKGIPNVYSASLISGEGGYFIGRLAAQITKTGKVSYLLGTSYPTVDYQVEMSKQAVKDLVSEGKLKEGQVSVSFAAVGSWDDTAKAKEITHALIEQGNDVIITLADSGDLGAIEAIRDARGKGKIIYGISWVTDKNALGKDFIIGGWSEDISAQMENIIMHIAEGKPGNRYPMGVADGVSYLNPMYGIVPEAVEKDIQDLYNRYRADPKSIPNLVARSDF